MISPDGHGSRVWPHVFIVLPVHNRVADTRRCLRLLEAQSYKSSTVVVCDDGSTDGTSEVIAREFPEVVLLQGDGNLWWTGATNLGVKYALSQGADYILTLNNDIEIPQNYLETLVGAAHQYPNAIIGSLLLTNERSPKVFFAGVDEIDWRTAKARKPFTFLEPFAGQYKGIRETLFLPGNGTLIPRGVFERVGLYDAANFPHYLADYEFVFRARKAGFTAFINYDAVIYSDIERTHKASVQKAPPLREFISAFFDPHSQHNIRIRYNFARKHCPRYYILGYMFLDTLRRFVSNLRLRRRLGLHGR